MKVDHNNIHLAHAYIVICNGKERGKTYNISNKRTNIGGRAVGVDICLNYSWIATHYHVAIMFENGKYYIQHLRSAMYASVNSERLVVKRVELKDNDIIELGKTILRFNRYDNKTA